MQVHEIRTWTDGEIEGRLEGAYRELFVLRGEKAAARLEDHNRIRIVKHNVARMKTILRERELSAELVGGGEAQ